MLQDDELSDPSLRLLETDTQIVVTVNKVVKLLITSNDVLHAGRDHSDNKLTMWINKDLSDDLNVSLSARFRQRKTNSSYDWVSDLKSFNQVQLWCKIRWVFSYDKY